MQIDRHSQKTTLQCDYFIKESQSLVLTNSSVTAPSGTLQSSHKETNHIVIYIESMNTCSVFFYSEGLVALQGI